MLNYYYYEKLNNNEKYAYDRLLNALINRQESVEINGLNQDFALKIIQYVSYDHPELYYFPNLFSNPRITNNSVIYNLHYYDVDDYKYNTRLEKLVDDLDKKMIKVSSNYGKIKIIFDYLASNIKYDTKILEKYQRLENENSSYDLAIDFTFNKGSSFTSYGALVNKKAVCMGIAKLFKILCQKFGIECATVSASYKKNNIMHMLNVVEYDGEQYYVDVTNGLMQDDFKMVKYNYFLVPKRIIGEFFELDEEFDCNSMNQTYYYKNHLIFKKLNDLKNYLASYEAYALNNEVRIYYEGRKLDDENLNNMVNYILNKHCNSGYYAITESVNGFCNALIVDKYYMR